MKHTEKWKKFKNILIEYDYLYVLESYKKYKKEIINDLKKYKSISSLKKQIERWENTSYSRKAPFYAEEKAEVLLHLSLLEKKINYLKRIGVRNV